MKLLLGTAQFGLNYGIANSTGILGAHEVSSILDLASTLGIDMLDTASAYGKSEKAIGDYSGNRFRIVTKLTQVPELCDDAYGWVKEEFFSSLRRLKADQVFGLLLHSPKQLLSPVGSEIYRALTEIRDKGFASKIGISIYSPDELPALLGNYDFDLIQAPMNIFDRRIIDSGWAQRLCDMGVELHTRSTFLQGLLLLPESTRPSKFNTWARHWSLWDNWLFESNLTPQRACILFSLQQTLVDRVLVGVDNTFHLQELVDCICGTVGNFPEFPPFEDERILDPSKWNEL